MYSKAIFLEFDEKSLDAISRLMLVKIELFEKKVLHKKYKMQLLANNELEIKLICPSYIT